MLNSNELPQRFTWVTDRTAGADAQRLLHESIISAHRENVSDLRKQEIQSAVLADARNILNLDASSLKLVNFTDLQIPGHKDKQCSGFQIYNTKELLEGDGSRATLITVIYIKDPESHKEIPLGFAHVNCSETGNKLITNLNRRAKEQYGTNATEILNSHGVQALPTPKHTRSTTQAAPLTPPTTTPASYQPSSSSESFFDIVALECVLEIAAEVIGLVAEIF